MAEIKERLSSTSSRGNRRKAANYDGKTDCEFCTSPVDVVVECDRCDKKVCLDCAEITQEEYDIFKAKRNFQWRCQICCEQPKTASRKKQQSELSIVLDQLKTMREDQNKHMRSFDQRLDNLEKKLESTIEQKVEEKVEKIMEERIERNFKDSIITEVRQIMKEHKDRELRENNLVFFNVPESKATEKTEKIQEDIQIVCEVLQAIGIKDEDYDITKAYRLGNPKSDQSQEGTKSRPLRVCLDKKESKKKVLGAAKKMKDVTEEKIKNIAISADMTSAQRQERNERRARDRSKTEKVSPDTDSFRDTTEEQ